MRLIVYTKNNSKLEINTKGNKFKETCLLVITKDKEKKKGAAITIDNRLEQQNHNTTQPKLKQPNKYYGKLEQMYAVRNNVSVDHSSGPPSSQMCMSTVNMISTGASRKHLLY